MSRNSKGGGRLPPKHQPHPDDPSIVYDVNHVTSKNRGEIHKSKKEFVVALYATDLQTLVKNVYISRTREMPDCVLFDGKIYVFHDTEQKPPQYVKAMVAEGSDNATVTEEHYNEQPT